MNTIKLSTVKLIQRILNPISEAGTIPYPELKALITEMTAIAKTGERTPQEPNRLMKMEEVAERLGLGLSTFKRLEKDGEITIPRRKLGNSIRYQLHHVLEFINDCKDDIEE